MREIQNNQHRGVDQCQQQATARTAIALPISNKYVLGDRGITTINIFEIFWIFEMVKLPNYRETIARAIRIESVARSTRGRLTCDH